MQPVSPTVIWIVYEREAVDPRSAIRRQGPVWIADDDPAAPAWLVATRHVSRHMPGCRLVAAERRAEPDWPAIERGRGGMANRAGRDRGSHLRAPLADGAG